ncbi:Alpha/Beta hydrolase protein [Fennellomyces sp. T-0311]|nr:Alpha/Beta hydrolase protein [Fennellomyces sp. T-0311]
MAATSTQLMMTPCTTEGCCQPFSETHGNALTNTTVTAVATTQAIVPIVVQELYKTALVIPSSVGRLASEIYSHLFVQKKKPLWNIQQTVVMAFLQVFRDHTLTHSLEFHRLMTFAPSLLTPITTKTQDGSFRVRRRNLRGILRECDKEEDGTRMLGCEWLSAGTVWDRCQSIVYPGTDIKGNQDIILDDEEPPRTQPQQQSNALVLRTRSPEKVVLYIHGGAYCAMSAQTHRALTHKISKATGRRIFAINYRLAPETKFPGGLYDAVQAYLYLIDADNGYCLDPKNVLFMGDSAGGGLCLATMLYLRDHGLPQPEGAVLLSPWVDLTFSYPSWDTASLYDYLPNNPDKIPNRNPAVLYLGAEKAARGMARHPYVSPLFAESFENLPPLLIQSGGCESLRDEINDLVNKLGATKTTLVHHEEYEDMVHVFQAFPFGKSAEAIESIGWWARLGMPMLQQMQSRGQIPGAMQPESGPFAVKGTPRSMGRRFHSIPC